MGEFAVAERRASILRDEKCELPSSLIFIYN